MESLGPQYCETFISGGGFPLEIVNTLTSLVPLFLGLGLLVWLSRHRSKDFVPYMLAALLMCTGVGSVLWHGFRTPLALTLDVLPGMLYFLTLLFVWTTALTNRWYGYGSVALLFLIQWLVGVVLTHYFPHAQAWPLFFVALGMGGVLTLWTIRSNAAAGNIAGWMMLAAMGAAIARTYDLSVCTTLPIGTHFLWHILLAVAGFLGVILIIKLKK